jgi:Cys-rich repeat protein
MMLAFGCPGMPPPECTTDADCPEGEICTDGVCVESEPECVTDADCDQGFCSEAAGNICVECILDEHCPTGQICDSAQCVDSPIGPADTFPTSLHDANFRGMEYFYSADQGGFESITGVPYGDDRLDCHVCHDKSRFENADPPVEWPGTDSCENCHVDPADPSQPVTEDICLGCHGRQKAEQTTMALTDVHRDAGFTCMNCHTANEMHGDGTVYNSILESPSPECADCHTEGGSAPVPPATITEHATHAANIDCAACHMQSVMSCYNCHFDTQLAGAGKRAFGQRKDFLFLVNRNGKVHGATFQSLVYEQNTFNVIAPYYAHSITADGRNCVDCHANFGGDIPAITEYNATGTMTLTTWDDTAEGSARLTGPTGLIPVPPDWSTAFEFAWLDYTGDPTTPVPETDPTLWVNIENGPASATQMLFATPLTEAQMNALGATGP